MCFHPMEPSHPGAIFRLIPHFPLNKNPLEYKSTWAVLLSGFEASDSLTDWELLSCAFIHDLGKINAKTQQTWDWDH